MLGQKPQIQT